METTEIKIHALMPGDVVLKDGELFTITDRTSLKFGAGMQIEGANKDETKFLVHQFGHHDKSTYQKCVR